MIKIAPSILAADFGDLRNQTEAVEKAGADWLHVDVMDGVFVPNISFGPDIVKVMRNSCGLFFDCHLMICKPSKYIENFVKAGANLITVHTECDDDPAEMIDLIHSYGIKAGVAINPATPAESVRALLEKADMILVMSVVPGFGGQKFMPEVLGKVREIRKMPYGENIDIEMDGGIGAQTAPKAAEAGVNILVAGSAVFKNQDMKHAIDEIRLSATVI